VLSRCVCTDEVNMSWTSWLMPSLIVWMLNGVVIAVVLARVFVFGEPVTKLPTASLVSYWRSRCQVDVYLPAVSCPHCSACLQWFSVRFMSVCLYMLLNCMTVSLKRPLLWPPCIANVDIIFLPCGFFFYLLSFLFVA